MLPNVKGSVAGRPRKRLQTDNDIISWAQPVNCSRWLARPNRCKFCLDRWVLQRLIVRKVLDLLQLRRDGPYQVVLRIASRIEPMM